MFFFSVFLNFKRKQIHSNTFKSKLFYLRMRPPYRTVFTIVHHIHSTKFILFVLKIIILARKSFRVLTSYMYSKTCLKRPLSKRPKMGFQDQLSLNAGQKYCRMLQGEHSAILRPALSYHIALRPLFCLFLRGRLRQVSPYVLF